MVMLKVMRRRARRILWVTLILIIPAFILWGTGEFRRRGINLVASVNGKGITREAYYKELQGLYQEMRERMGDNFNEEMAKALNLESVALNGLIERELLFQEARREKIRVSDQELREEIKSYPAFQKEGKFDKETYFALLDWLEYTPQKFEEEMRQDISITKLRNMVLEGVGISEEEIRDEYLKKNEEIEIEYLLLKPAEEAKIEEKEIEKEDFEVLAKRLSLEVKGTGPFKRGESDLPREIEEEAFRLKVGEVKGPLRGGDGYYIVKVTKRKGMDEERFSQEREAFTEDFIQKKKVMVYNRWHQELYQRAKIKIYSLEER